jgi:hypothetical protein
VSIEQVFHQIALREGRIDRVPKGEVPVIELHLNEGEYITSVKLEPIDLFSNNAIERKTRDWRWKAYVVTPLPNTNHRIEAQTL